ncbi:hypothetical protein D1781_13590 [Amnibacterium setariae]|uniref:Uncharacterized protein n=1 Tax=Amnibacterium setariae TaxID=2306585 RepID=A0A3A1U1X5_9MICO|nr:hypothetical protein D1781_13590 [Amnibacterium setariae]
MPDLFVAQRGVRLANGQSEWLPVVGIEAKFGAMVNSAFDYCPAGEHILEESGDRYSSQVICYVNGCWLADSAEEEVRPIGYVWLGRKPKMVGPAFVAREKVPEFAEAQREALEQWKSMDHWDIVGERGLMNRAGLPGLAAALRPHLARWSSAASGPRPHRL